MKKALIALLFTAASLTACHNPYQSGVDALAEQNFDGARAHARESLNDEPGSPERNLLMAEALMGLEKFRQAEPYAKKAFESRQLDAQAGRVYGKILWELGMPIEAVRAWSRARIADPDSVSEEDYLRALETALAMAVHQHDFDQAIKLRDELASLVPDHPDVSTEATRKLREQWAADLVRRGRYEDAVELYQELAKDHPKFAPGYYFEIGWHQQQLGRPDAAIEAFREYVDAADGAMKVGRLLDVARRAERLGASEVARTFYIRAVELTDDPSARADIRIGLAELFLDARMKDEARAQLIAFLTDRAIAAGASAGAGGEVSPDSIPGTAYEAAAERAVDGRAPELAIEILEKAVAVDAPAWRPVKALAELYARRARMDDVERLLKAYVEGRDDSATARITAGRWAAERRAFELALFFMEPAATGETTPPEMWLELARIYSALSRVSDVRRSLKTYVKESDGSKSALMSVASIYRAMRLYEDAEDALERAFARDKTSFSVVRSLESLYDEWRQPQKISKIYDQWIAAGGDRGRDYEMAGERFARQGRYDEALEYLEKAATKGENDARLQIADIYLRQRRNRDMKDALDAYLSNADNRRSALEAVWQRYRRSGNSMEGIGILEELVELDPSDLRHYDDLARLYLELGQERKALEMWKRFVESSNNPIIALEMMRSRVGGSGRSELMLELLEDYISSASEPDPKVYKLLGDAYFANRSRRAAAEDGVYPRQDRAHRYYRLYLEKASPERRELATFADEMQSRRYYDIAVVAYQQMDLDGANDSRALLDYGVALLNTGDAELAVEAFGQFFERRERSAEAAFQIARRLSEHERYDVLDPYIVRVMDANDENLLTAGFNLGAQTLLKTDRVEEIPALAEQYLDRTNNPPEARRKVVEMYESAGLWDYAIAQLQQMSDLGSGEHGFEIGRTHYRKGDVDAAESAFREWASDHPARQLAWQQIADFFEQNGERELADVAWTQAVNANPDTPEVLGERGRFRVMTGRIEEGRADFEEARLVANSREAGLIWRKETEALRDAGLFTAATEAAREGLRVALVDRSVFYDVIVETELSSGDPVRIERLVDEMKNSGFAVRTLASGLARYGHTERVVDIIEDEIVNGDPTTGFELLSEHSDLVLRVGGIDLLTRISEPLVQREQRRKDITGEIGKMLAASGRYAQAAFLLENSEESGFSHSELLGRIYLLLDDEERALRAHQDFLLSRPEEAAPDSLQFLLFWYDLQNRRDLFERLLARIENNPAYEVPAFRHRIANAIDQGRPGVALDAVRRIFRAANPEVAVQNNRSEESVALQKFVSGAEELAARGHARDVVPLLDDVPADLRGESALLNLRLRLAANFAVLELDDEIASFMKQHDSGVIDDASRIKFGTFLLTTGNFTRAEEMTLPLVQSSLPKTASEAVQIVVGARFGRGDGDGARKVARSFAESQPNPMDARSKAAEALQYIGYDDVALDLQQKSVAIAPNANHVRQKLLAAFFAGVPQDDLVELFEEYHRVREGSHSISFNPLLSSASSYLEVRNLLNHEESILIAFDNYPDAYYARLARALVAYLRGDVTMARELITTLLDARGWDPNTVDEVARHFEKRRLWSDLARFLGPKVTVEDATIPTLRRIGLANHRLGFEKDAERFLDAYVKRSNDPVFASSVIANALNEQGDYQAARDWAGRALALGPMRPDALLESGIARLNLGEEGGKEQLDAALESGFRYTATLKRATEAAARSGRADLAADYYKRVVRNPFDSVSAILAPLQDVAESNPDIFQQLLDRTLPRVASLDVQADEGFIPGLVSAYQAAGWSDAAVGAYELALTRAQAVGPMVPSMSNQLSDIWTIKNNMAYVMSVEDLQIDRGLQLIRQSMAGFTASRMDSYIDTLGWLYYRQGDLARAEAEVRRALRTSQARGRSDYDPTELYEHLAILEEARGAQGDAVWTWMLIEMLKP